MKRIKSRARLKHLNTFSVDVYANKIITVYNEHDLFEIWHQNYNKGESVLILGEGSNVLFVSNYNGTVLLNRIKGIFVTDHRIAWKLHVGAGEKWRELVQYTIDNNMPGLENLANIPGYVGAATINNIGAYGVELSKVCEYVDVVDLVQGNKMRFSCNECNFQYRGSIFKNHSNKYAVVYIGIKLYKAWKPTIHYFKLSNLNTCSITPLQILNTIVLVRNQKIPNPKVNGNAGSFFKNPIVSIEIVNSLFRVYPNMPYYLQSDGTIKLFAGWLIESCKLKGYSLGEASVYHKQALILINNRQRATGVEIAKLASFIYYKVLDKFNIRLEPEVKFIGRKGEINPKDLFQTFYNAYVHMEFD